MQTDPIEWRPVTLCPGEYEVSSDGQVRSLTRQLTQRNRWGTYTTYTKHGRVLKPWSCNAGYATVWLVGPAVGRMAVNVHRLVALAFVEPVAGKPEVNHIDGDKRNNKVGNLEWTDRSGNNLHALRTGLRRVDNKGLPLYRPVIATPKKGGQPIRFANLLSAAEHFGGPTMGSNIRSAVVGHIPSAYGYTWRYEVPSAQASA